MLGRPFFFGKTPILPTYPPPGLPQKKHRFTFCDHTFSGCDHKCRFFSKSPRQLGEFL